MLELSGGRKRNCPVFLGHLHRNGTAIVNILLTSVGRRVELVRAFRRAYDRLGLLGRIVATDVDWLAPALQEVDEAHLVPIDSHPQFLDALIDVCREESIDVVFPLTDPQLSYLAKGRARIESESEAQVAVVDERAAEICGDKWQTFQFFQQLGLPTCESWLPDIEKSVIEYPVFAKPRDGSAGMNTFCIRSPEEYRFFSRYIPRPIMQEFLPGPEITSDVVCGLDGRVMAVVSRQRIAVRGGEAIKSVTIEDERIEQACRQIAAGLPARGPITVQCMMKDGIPHFVEINARLGGGVPLAIGAGVDVPAFLLSDVSGLSYASLESRAQPGIYMTRCDESFFITEAAREAHQGHRLRSG